jgi:hypothetical protein
MPVVAIVTATAHFMARHLLWFLVLAMVTFGVLFGWSEYTRQNTTDITLCVGPAGSDGWDDARRIADRINASPPHIGARYNVTLVETDGFEENRKRVSRDTSGSTIGFAHDGFGDSSRISILTPLEYSFLHVFCTRKFLKDHKIPIDSNRAPALAEIVRKFDHGLVFLGPPESGTRQAAEIVLRNYNIEPAKLATNGVADYNEMRAALINGTICAAFYSGPWGSSLVRQIADDQSCRLVNFEDVRDALVQQNRQLHKAAINRNSYIDGDFCATDIQTIGTRRVIICPRTMSAQDAYFIGKCAHDVMQDQVGALDWEAKEPADVATNRFTYPMHPAAILLSKDMAPTTWITKWSVVLSTLLVWVATSLLHDWNTRATRQESAKAATGENLATQKLSTYDEFEAAIEREHQCLHQASDPLEPSWCQKFRASLRGLFQNIKTALRRATLTDEQAESLLEGVLELYYEIDLRNPPQSGAVHAVPTPDPKKDSGEEAVAV